MNTIQSNQAHVYFWALPVGTKFEHKSETWEKTAEEQATDSNGKEWRFEVHYGCIIQKEVANEIGIEKDGYRPLN